jgi:hypothetical protein
MDQQKILQFIRSRGLVLPVQLASEFKQNSFITGAILSSLVKANQLQISSTKVGGSPVYYFKDQEAKLQELYKNLNDKDKRSYDMLKERRVLRDRDLSPLPHVSIRNIRDFAKPFEIEVADGKELFWRWYLLPEQEAVILARQIISPAIAQPESAPEKPMIAESVPPRPTKPIELVRTEHDEEDIPVVIEKPAPKPAESSEQIRIGQLPAEPHADSLHEKTKKYFNSAGIIIKKVEVLKRNAEIDYLIEVPSAVGPVTYYCKARAKKKCSEGDLAAAFVKGQTKKLPVLFVTTGDCTKKAMEMLTTDFPGMKVRSLEVKP